MFWHKALTQHRIGDGLAKQAAPVGEPITLAGLAILAGLAAIFGGQEFARPSVLGPLATQLVVSVMSVSCLGFLKTLAFASRPWGGCLRHLPHRWWQLRCWEQGHHAQTLGAKISQSQYPLFPMV